MDSNKAPLGFSFALARNPKAMKAFIRLPQTRQNEILQQVQDTRSRDEVRQLVDSLLSAN